jgi:hypothetical protein
MNLWLSALYGTADIKHTHSPCKHSVLQACIISNLAKHNSRSWPSTYMRKRGEEVYERKTRTYTNDREERRMRKWEELQKKQ